MVDDTTVSGVTGASCSAVLSYAEPGVYTVKVTVTDKDGGMPTGNTEFNFKAGDLNFHSSSYDWLVVAGANAKYKGVGTINGEGYYGFMLTATDGSPDTFRIKIWDKDKRRCCRLRQPDGRGRRRL